ncbi:MAG: WecB/TagA/CpsF family glycosyltransferase [Erysipelotrichaceae bacterium]
MKKILERVYKGEKSNFFKLIENSLVSNKKMFIVTANPEILMMSERDCDVFQMLTENETVIVADGIGVVKACGMIMNDLVERIAGVDTVMELLELGNKLHKHLFILGATESVLIKLRQVLIDQYPNIIIDGMINGYTEDKDAVFEEIKKKNSDIVLVALGVPKQEKLIFEHLSKFDKGIFIGIGGSLDVISGSKKRAPKLFIKMNLEWLYRILREPKRIKRFYESNVKFIFRLRNEIKGEKQND